MFEIGNRVKVNSEDLLCYNGRKILHGTIKGGVPHQRTPWLIEFDEYIGGHDGYPEDHGIVGKEGHCWYLPALSITRIKGTSQGDSKLKHYFL
jgi:hypothetical protein